MIKLIDLLNEYKINKPGKYIIPVPNNPDNANWPSELGIDSGYYIRPTTYKNFKETIKNDFNEGIEFYLEEFEDDDDINVEDYTDDQLLDIIINKFSYVMFNTEEEVEDYFELLDYVVSNQFGDNASQKEEEQQIFNSIDSADDTIWKIWPKPQFLNTLNEYEIKKPTLFNTDSSKGKLWVEYNPKLRKIDSKELSLLNRVYSALKPVENRLDDSLRLSPSLDRVMMKYGYWEWIEDREILKALKDFNVEIEDDYDDDRGQTTYYMVKDK
jgi:hypothetical protein